MHLTVSQALAFEYNIRPVGVLANGRKPEGPHGRPEIFVDTIQPPINQSGLQFMNISRSAEDSISWIMLVCDGMMENRKALLSASVRLGVQAMLSGG